MSSPGGSGPRASQRHDPSDATVTASLPAVSDAGPDSSPYPHGGMPGAASRDEWKGRSVPVTPPGGSATRATEVVPNVGPAASEAARPVGAAVGAGAVPAGRMPFGDALPPRPGEGNGRPSGSGTTTVPPKRPLRERAQAKPARRAQLTLRRLNVWSVFKFSCMLAIALWLVWMIAIGVLYGILDGAGVVKSINDVYSQIQGSGSGDIVRPGQVLGIAAIVGVVNIVLFIALSSLFAVIYNLVSDFVGGVEVTLSERE